MHGRVKVRTTAEQEALKKKERAEKLSRYRIGMSIVFKKRKDKIYDDELMMVTERMVLQNPDIYTLWNIRREAFTNNDWVLNGQTTRVLLDLCIKKRKYLKKVYKAYQGKVLL